MPISGLFTESWFFWVLFLQTNKTVLIPMYSISMTWSLPFLFYCIWPLSLFSGIQTNRFHLDWNPGDSTKPFFQRSGLIRAFFGTKTLLGARHKRMYWANHDPFRAALSPPNLLIGQCRRPVTPLGKNAPCVSSIECAPSCYRLSIQISYS